MTIFSSFYCISTSNTLYEFYEKIVKIIVSSNIINLVLKGLSRQTDYYPVKIFQNNRHWGFMTRLDTNNFTFIQHHAKVYRIMPLVAWY